MKVKILVIRFSSIGDIVLTSPVVRCLKNQVKNAELHFVTKQKFAGILTSNPNISKVHIFKDNLTEVIEKLKAENFDYIIDLHHNFRSGRIKRSLKTKTYSLHKLNWQKFLLINLKINRLPNLHVVDRYMETVKPLSVNNDGKGLEFFIPNADEFSPADLPAPFQKGFVAFVIAGTYNTKKLPVDKVAQICQAIDYPVILLGGKKEYEAGEQVLALSKGNVLNFAGKISLNQSASLVKNARLVLTNDTGLMHIASAFHKKILSFWGNTVPDFGMVPYQADLASKILEVNGLKCRPCSKLGYKNCPKNHFKCMKEMNIDEAVKWINANY